MLPHVDLGAPGTLKIYPKPPFPLAPTNIFLVPSLLGFCSGPRPS